MAQTDLEYILKNKKWLHAKSLMSYLSAGFGIVAIVAFLILLGLGLQSTVDTALKNTLKNADTSTFINVFGSIIVSLCIIIAINVGIQIYTGLQYKKIANSTDLITEKDSLKPSVDALTEYNSYFKYLGIAQIVSVFISIVLFIVFAISLIGIFTTIYNNSQNSSSSTSLKSDY